MDLSVVVAFHEMGREAPRTLFSLSRTYQRKVNGLGYEVIAVDNGSTRPLDRGMVEGFGTEFRLHRHSPGNPSPVAAINAALSAASGRWIMICIDGARILSPGVLWQACMAANLHPRAVVSTLAWHLGQKPQNASMLDGYDQAEEDRLLAASGWEQDGYRLFGLSALAGSSRDGFFATPSESNALLISREHLEVLGGFDLGFTSPGGGLANLDLYKRACETPDAVSVLLLGEGTFHQFHGGVATNLPPDRHPFARYQDEYFRLRGVEFSPPAIPSLLFGEVTPAVLPWIRDSALAALARGTPSPASARRR